jgi:lincosamide nucleotidyltransferase A/C/D/E
VGYAAVRAEDVLAVLDRLGAAGVAVWLDGGWGIDALLGRQSRAHADADPGAAGR